MTIAQPLICARCTCPITDANTHWIDSKPHHVICSYAVMLEQDQQSRKAARDEIKAAFGLGD